METTTTTAMNGIAWRFDCQMRYPTARGASNIATKAMKKQRMQCVKTWCETVSSDLLPAHRDQPSAHHDRAHCPSSTALQMPTALPNHDIRDSTERARKAMNSQKEIKSSRSYCVCNYASRSSHPLFIMTVRDLSSTRQNGVLCPPIPVLQIDTRPRRASPTWREIR